MLDLEVLMMKHCINYSIVYTVLAIIGGMLYREFTKMDDYTAWTTLFVVHTHYIILGMMFFFSSWIDFHEYEFKNKWSSVVL